MEFNIGDTVRIVSDPNIWFFGGGDYEIGDIATIEAIELNNQRVWYKLDVEMFDEDQTTWQEKNLELVSIWKHRLFARCTTLSTRSASYITTSVKTDCST